MMRNMAGMVRKVQEMQVKIETLKDELESLHFFASAGNNQVKVTVTGSGILHAIKIDPSVAGPEDIETLEDLICLATRSAQTNASAEKARLLKDITGELPLPPGVGLPL